MSIGVLGFVVWSQNLFFLLLLINLCCVYNVYKYKKISKIFTQRHFATGSYQKLNPYFITGFCDGESYFNVSISKNSKLKVGWAVKLSFGINLHKKDQELLENIKVFFNEIGVIMDREKNVIKFTVTSITDLEIIINHFDKYLLITQKQADYLLFKQVFDLVKHKNHLTFDGLKEIVKLKASINKGLNDELKEAYPDILPTIRPLIKQEIYNPYWLVGFVSAEGCFRIKISKSNTHKIGYSIGLRFLITQHIRDEQLLISFKNYFGCGEYKQRKGQLAGDFNVNKTSDIFNIIIPFFEKYPLYGIKALNYLNFCKAAEIIKSEKHLSPAGLDLLIKLKNDMN
jgi:hypothetical protein